MYRIGMGSSFVRFERCLCDTCATRTKVLESHPYCLLPLALSQLGTCGISAFAGHSTTANSQFSPYLFSSTFNRQHVSQHSHDNLLPPASKPAFQEKPTASI